MSRDRVGIVHEIASAIADLEGDLADTQQSVLWGYFTMILLATFPEAVSRRDIERKLAEVDSRSDTKLETAVKQVRAEVNVAQPAIPEHTYVLTAKGQDRIGFVAAVSGFCARNTINILDLSTTVSDGSYIMILIVDLTQAAASIDGMRHQLRQFAQENEFNVVLQHYDIFRATNEIN